MWQESGGGLSPPTYSPYLGRSSRIHDPVNHSSRIVEATCPPGGRRDLLFSVAKASLGEMTYEILKRLTLKLGHPQKHNHPPQGHRNRHRWQSPSLPLGTGSLVGPLTPRTAAGRMCWQYWGTDDTRRDAQLPMRPFMGRHGSLCLSNCPLSARASTGQGQVS